MGYLPILETIPVISQTNKNVAFRNVLYFVSNNIVLFLYY